MRSAAVIGIILVSLGMLGCPEYRDEISEEALGRIDISPASLDFGWHEVGTTVSERVTVRNIGQGPLRIEPLFIDGSSEYTLEGGAGEQVLQPGKGFVVTVSFTPHQACDPEGQLFVDSDDPTRLNARVTLAGDAVLPILEISPSDWTFDDREIGCEQEQPFTLRNVGCAPLTLDGLEFVSTSDEMGFSHYFNEGTVLAPGATETVTVYYEPRDEQADTAFLQVFSDDPWNPVLQATVTGAAHLPPQVIDEYNQEFIRLADILWLVDDSGSMADFQASVDSNRTYFESQLGGYELDLHVETLNVGENLLSTASTMLSPPMTDQGGPMEGFLREEAGLQVFIVSDEDDQSAGDVQDHVQTLQSLKADPAHVNVSAVSGQANGCSDGQASAFPAPRLELAVTLSGGDSASICDPSWYPQLDAVSWLPGTWQDTFDLTQFPVEETIEVELNHVPVYVGWTFDGVYNAVVFEPDYTPGAGDLITISYNLLGTCDG